MTNLDKYQYYLGITVIRDRANRILRLGQVGYIQKFITKHSIQKSKGTSILMGIEKYQATKEDFQATKASRTAYQSAIGLLIYTILGTRPDIVCRLLLEKKYGLNLNESYWKAVKRIFRYLRQTVNYQLVFRGELRSLSGYIDAN